MERYVALDVALNEVSVCILDEKGQIAFEGKTPADPSALVDLIQSKAPGSFALAWRLVRQRHGCSMH